MHLRRNNAGKAPIPRFESISDFSHSFVPDSLAEMSDRNSVPDNNMLGFWYGSRRLSIQGADGTDAVLELGSLGQVLVPMRTVNFQMILLLVPFLADFASTWWGRLGSAISWCLARTILKPNCLPLGTWAVPSSTLLILFPFLQASGDFTAWGSSWQGLRRVTRSGKSCRG